MLEVKGYKVIRIVTIVDKIPMISEVKSYNLFSDERQRISKVNGYKGHIL